MTTTAPRAFDIPTTLELAHTVKLSILGDTFAIHDVGTRLAQAELLAPLVNSERGPHTTTLTLLASAAEITQHYGLPAPAKPDLTTVLPALDTTREALSIIFAKHPLGWGHCHLRAGLLEDEDDTPAPEGELRLLISPENSTAAQPPAPEGTLRFSSPTLGQTTPTTPDAALMSTVIERSQSEDLLATIGLAAFVRRNPGVLPRLHGNTLHQLAYEFPDALGDTPAR